MARLFQIATIWTGILSSFFCSSCQRSEMQIFQHKNSSGKFWATGYLPGWRHTDQAIPFMTEADYRFLTHIIHFGGMPKPDGSIDVAQLNVGPACRKLAVQLAHAAGKPILFSVVEQYPAFNAVIENPQMRQTFIDNLIAIMEESDYDGIDLDMEPVCAPFGSFGYQGVDLTKHPEFKTEFPVNHAYISLVNELRQALDQRKTAPGERPLLTTAMLWRDPIFLGERKFTIILIRST